VHWLENSLYALGGCDNGRSLYAVQRLSLSSLTWELLQLKLPQAANCVPCFKTDTQVCLVIERALYSFTHLEVKPMTPLLTGIWCISSYYSRGTLYYEGGYGISTLGVGELTLTEGA
jgi:hypothetical protein